jgi:hypothetical protein
MWVRIISYRVTDERLGEPDKVYRLVTTLLNPRVAPALKLIELYHERWEVELVLDEIKTHARRERKVLRSKTPEGVRQELYGLFQLTEMLDLALILQPEQACQPLGRRLPHQMRHVLLPARRLRVNRREVKQVYSKHTPVAGGMCLPPNPLSHMSSFWTLSRCLIRWLPFLLRRPLSEMYCPLSP